MITILTLKLNYSDIHISFMFYPEYIRRLKKIGAIKINDTLYKIGRSQLAYLEIEFGGELYFETPRYIITGEKPTPINLELKNKYEIPSLSNDMKPYPYQAFGYQFLRNRLDEYGFALLGDSVGLGKTLETIMTALSLINEGKTSKVLILCKKSLKKQWAREFEKFTDLKERMPIEYIPENALKKKRKEIYKSLDLVPECVLITTYESCMNDSALLRNLNFDFVAIDECHLVKAYNKAKNKAVKETIKDIKYKVLMTGTPITNKPADLYGIVNLCSDNYFDMNITAFKKRYLTIWLTKSRGAIEVGYKNIEELRQKCQKIMIRRTENEVDIDLPKIEEVDVFCTIDAVQERLSQKVMAMVQRLNTNLQEKAPTLDNVSLELETKRTEDMIKGCLGLRQVIANDPFIFRYGSSGLVRVLLKGEMAYNKYGASNKTRVLFYMLKGIIEAGQKAIVFSKHERSVRYLFDRFKSLETNITTYTGKLNENERMTSIDNFCDDESYGVLIATNSAAEGLNLMVANHVINYDLPDTLALGVQRMGRVRRAGSEYSKGFYYNLISKGTVDEKVKEKLLKQSKLTNSVVELDVEQSKNIRELSN